MLVTKMSLLCYAVPEDIHRFREQDSKVVDFINLRTKKIGYPEKLA